MPWPAANRPPSPIPTAILRALEGATTGTGPSPRGAHERIDELADIVAALTAELDELRRQVAPASTLILTGPKVLEAFRRLR